MNMKLRRQSIKREMQDQSYSVQKHAKKYNVSL